MNVIEGANAKTMNAILEEQFLDGSINEEQLATEKGWVQRVEGAMQQLDQLGVPKPAQQAYVSAMQEVSELEKKMEGLTEPDLIAKVSGEITAKKDEMNAIIDGKKSLVSVIMPTGQSFTVQESQLGDIVAEKELGKYIQSGVVVIQPAGGGATEASVSKALKKEGVKQGVSEDDGNIAKMDEQMDRLSQAKADIDEALGIKKKDETEVKAETPTVKESRTVETPTVSKVATVETPKAKESSTSKKYPSDEQMFKDVRNGDLVSFTYEKEGDVPDVFKNKISSKGEINGKKYVKVTVPKSLADYELTNGIKEAEVAATIPDKVQVKPLEKANIVPLLTKVDAAVESKGAEGRAAREAIKQEFGQEAYDKAVKVTNNFEGIIKNLEEQGKIKKICP
jgi:hypothetical protein